MNSKNYISGNRITSLVTRMHLSPEDIKKMYRAAFENNLKGRIEEMCLSHVIRPEFKFLGPLYYHMIAEKKFHLLPLPAFSTTSKDFSDLVKDLTGGKFSKGLVKRFGQMTEIHGVVFLNNVFYLNQIYADRPLNIDDVLNLDHSKKITGRTVHLMEDLKCIRDRYPLQRIWNILADIDIQVLEETHYLVAFNRMKNMELIINSLPNKPKNIAKIHDAVSLAIMNQKKTNLVLDQDIAYLDGKPLLEFMIQVPTDSFALVSTSTELRHCVHGYDQAVIKKECQILNLLDGEKRLYTIELRPDNGTYKIRQFKGFQNENSMEGSAGEIYRKELLRMLGEDKVE